MASKEPSVVVEEDADPQVVEDDSAGKAQPSTADFLAKFKPPRLATISRKRSLPSNVTPGNSAKRSCPGRSDETSASFVPNVSAKERVNQFPDEYLTVDAGKLFCSCCREELPTMKSSIAAHVKSAEHLKSKEKQAQRKDDTLTISDYLKNYVSQYHPSGENLPESTRLYRLRVTHCLVEAGIPLYKITGSFRDLLEENGHRLTAGSHLSECIPVVHSMYVKQVSAELEGVPVSIIFDGSTRLGEAFALVVRFVTTDLKICQQLLSLKCVAKSMSASDVSGLLVDVLMENFHLSRRNIFAAMRDGASVNVAAQANLKQVFPTIIDITCFSHTLDRAGQYFNTPNATEFVNSWISLFAYSFKARLAFKEKTGMNPKLLSKTRWWSRWEVIKQIVELFPDVHGFIASRTEISPATVRKLLAMLDAPQLRALVQVEMAAVVDAGELIVKATYDLEGDGPLALVAYKIIKEIEAGVALNNFPQLQALCQKLNPDNAEWQQQLVDYDFFLI